MERGFPAGSGAKNPPAKAGDMGSILGREAPLEEGTAPTPVFLPGDSRRQRSLVGYSQVTKEADAT